MSAPPENTGSVAANPTAPSDPKIAQQAQGSHALNPETTSKLTVPPKVQSALPEKLEHALPNKMHDTGDPESYSHDKGHSYVPKRVAESLPSAVERAVPDAIHDTTGEKSAEKGVFKEGHQR